jgi:hypothetical protein
MGSGECLRSSRGPWAEKSPGFGELKPGARWEEKIMRDVGFGSAF